jgi:excisionase family DNA binding protein
MQTVAPPPFQLYTADETAKLLKITSRHLRNLEKRGHLRAVRSGRSVRYSAGDLSAYVQRLKQSGFGDLRDPPDGDTLPLN